MLVTIQAMCDRIRRRSVRIARPAPKGNISKRLKLLDEMQQKLDSLLKQHPSWKSDTLVRVFKAELREQIAGAASLNDLANGGMLS
jgi:hypothetical protein